MNRRQAELVFALVLMARATSLVFTRFCLLELDGFNLLALRFGLAFVLLAALFHRRMRRITRAALAQGAVLGLFYFLVMACEQIAIRRTPTGVLSALINTAIVMVPLLNAALQRRRPHVPELICAFVALLGVALMNFTTQGLTLGLGVAMGLVEALFYACLIIVTDRFAHRREDTLTMGVVQVGTLALLALATSVIFEQPHLPQQGQTWLMTAALAVVCTGFGCTLQPVMQRYLTAEITSLMCAISPATAATLGIVVLHESATLPRLLGMGLILFSLLLPHLPLMAHLQKGRDDLGISDVSVRHGRHRAGHGG